MEKNRKTIRQMAEEGVCKSDEPASEFTRKLIDELKTLPDTPGTFGECMTCAAVLVSRAMGIAGARPHEICITEISAGRRESGTLFLAIGQVPEEGEVWEDTSLACFEFLRFLAGIADKNGVLHAKVVVGGGKVVVGDGKGGANDGKA